MSSRAKERSAHRAPAIIRDVALRGLKGLSRSGGLFFWRGRGKLVCGDEYEDGKETGKIR